jgi:hypothetical protein
MRDVIPNAHTHPDHVGRPDHEWHAIAKWLVRANEIAMNARIYYNIKTRLKLSILINSVEKQADLSFALGSRPFNCCLYFKTDCLWDGSWLFCCGLEEVCDL